MKANYTHIILLIDRSGSMSGIKEDMEGGIQSFIANQLKEKGECTLTAAQFDNEYEIIYNRVTLKDIKKISIAPRGSTALIDSMYRLIDEVDADLSSIPESERPERVLFVTITDGYENASRKYTNEQLAELIKFQQDKYSWNFTYIGANQDAFEEASKFGGKQSTSLNYNTNSKSINNMFNTLSDATSRYRNSFPCRLLS